jgi:DNA-binding response OmpR family regulator
MKENKIIILLNDKDILMAKVCKNKFQKQEGWNSVITSDFETAITEIKKQKPNIILTDILLNSIGKDGFDLINEVKLENSLIDTKIIVFTELNQESDIKKAKDLGADEYFIKSQMTINQVIEKIKELV